MHNKLTMDNMKKLQEELEYRFTVLRAQIAKDKMEAAAHGDRSENAEYKAACEEYRKNDRRIQYLLSMLSTAEVIDNESMDADELGVDRSARVRFSDDEEEVTLRLVTTVDRDPLKMYISIESELGVALIGKKAGDTVSIDAPGGSYSVTVLEVLAE